MIQYVHRNKQVPKGFKKTFAFKTPSASDVFKSIKEKLKGNESFLSLEVGISHVHRKDNYCKKIGREYAVERLTGKQFIIADVSFPEPMKVDLLLVAKDDSMALKVGLTPGKKTARVLAVQLATDGMEV